MKTVFENIKFSTELDQYISILILMANMFMNKYCRSKVAHKDTCILYIHVSNLIVACLYCSVYFLYILYVMVNQVTILL